MAKYRVLVISLLLKNNEMAAFGDEVSASQLTRTAAELVKEGFIKEAKADTLHGAEQAEADRLAKEKEELEKAEKDAADAEKKRLEEEAEQAEADRLAKEKEELEKAEKDAADAEKKRLEEEAEQAEADRLAKEKEDADELEKTADTVDPLKIVQNNIKKK